MCKKYYPILIEAFPFDAIPGELVQATAVRQGRRAGLAEGVCLRYRPSVARCRVSRALQVAQSALDHCTV